MPLKDMYEPCGQCGFDYARVDTEAWGRNSARRLMCPVCGWTAYEEIVWEGNQPHQIKRNESQGFGAFRLIPPGGYCGYNAFHEQPSADVLQRQNSPGTGLPGSRFCAARLRTTPAFHESIDNIP